MKLNDRGLLVVISGPSGVGKGTVNRKLFSTPGHNFEYSVSMTTRPIRPGEVDGKDYYFISRAEFEQKIKDNAFLEYAEFVGNYYGTPLDIVEERLNAGKEVVLEIEVEGAMQVRKRVPDAVLIFIVPPSKKTLYDRLKRRGTEDDKTIAKRIAKADREFKLAHKYDYIVCNDDVDAAANSIISIVRAEHSKTFRAIEKYLKLIEE